MIFLIMDNLFIIFFDLKALDEGKIKEDALKVLVAAAKKHPYEVLNDYFLNSVIPLSLPLDFMFSSKEKTCFFNIFKEILKKGDIKKGQSGTEIMEELLFVGEKMEKKKNIIKVEEELLNEVIDFVKVSKEKGLEGRLWKNKNVIAAEYYYIDWMGLCKEEVRFFFFFSLLNNF